MTLKFTKEDRALVKQELERIQHATLTPSDVSRKLFADGKKFYAVFGGTGDWHGLPDKLVQFFRQHRGETVLVIAKKFATRINVCVAPVTKLIANIDQLVPTRAGGFHFHTVLEDDGMHVFQIPELKLQKISAIPLRSVKKTKLPPDISEIINIEMLPPNEAVAAQSDEEHTHTDIQAKLILIGSCLGYRTFTPDRSKTSRYGKLGDLCSEKELPRDYLPDRQVGFVKHIDVLWFDQDGLPTHGFEVEHTTDVTKGLLRLFQVRKLRIRMFIIAASSARTKFETELRKDPFHQVKEAYVFKTYDDLEGFYASVKQFTALRQEFLLEERKTK